MQRAYFALGAKDVQFQKCDVDLRNKAQWHLDINNGLVPVLESPDGMTVYESAVIADIASNLQRDSGLPLWPHEAEPNDLQSSIATAKIKLEMLNFDRMAGEYYFPAQGTIYKDQEKVDALREALPSFEDFVKRNLNGQKFFGGPNPMYMDIHCYPIFERLMLLENGPGRHGWDAL